MQQGHIVTHSWLSFKKTLHASEDRRPEPTQLAHDGFPEGLQEMEAIGAGPKLLPFFHAQSPMAATLTKLGNCYDNAMVETFFKTNESELVWRTVFYTRDEAAQAIARYIDGFYNPVRRHSALDYISPAQFERTVAR